MKNKSNETVTEQQKKSSPVYYQVLKILYAPHKAFKEITQNQKYIGPVLILILFVATSAGYGYAILSRSYIEQTLPKVDSSAGHFDAWTENANLWSSPSGANVRENFTDFINGSYYGNRSIEFSMLNSPQISMQLMNIGQINCSGPDGYKNVSLRAKLVDPQNTNFSSAFIYLFSGNTSNYSYYNLTDTFSNSTANVWYNLTIPLAEGNWANNSTPADWSNITGLKLEFSWPQNVNSTMLIDGLFFRGVFQGPSESAAASYLFSDSVSSLFQFVIRWIFISGILFLAVKALGAKTPWKPILISVGFALIILVVQTIANTIAVSTLITLHYPLEFLGGTSAETTAAFNQIISQTSVFYTVTAYIQMAVLIWIIALCAIATRLLVQFSWIKSAVAGMVAVAATYFIGLILGI